MAELKQYHARIIKFGLSSDNDAMGGVIKLFVSFEFSNLEYAVKVFDSPDPFIYNTMIRGYLQLNSSQNCLLLYIQMLEKSVAPNQFTLPSVIRACCVGDAFREGKQVHAHVIKHGFSIDGFSQNNLIHMYLNFNNHEDAKRVFDNMVYKDDVSWTTMITGYAHSGYIHKAYEVFESIPMERWRNSAVVWNAMIAGYVQSNRFAEALALFKKMRKENVRVDKFVAASMLSACTGLGALEQRKWIHKHIKEIGIEVDSKLATTIIDMYRKCGCLDNSFEVFNGLSDDAKFRTLIDNKPCII